MKHKGETNGMIENPLYEHFVLEGLRESKCFKIVNSRVNKVISVVHDRFCWSFYSPCSTLDEPPPDDAPIMDSEADVLHLVDALMIEGNNIDWEHYYRLVVGYNLED